LKVLILRPNYFPEIAGGTRLAVDLVEDLVSNGIEVVLVAPFPFRADEETKEKYKNLKVETLHEGKLKIIRIDISANENSLISRAWRYLAITVVMFWKGLGMKNIDAIMSISMPPLLGPVSVLLGKIKKKPVLYWEQDVVSESLISTGVASKGIKKRILYTAARFLEEISSKGSDHIVTISKKFMDRHIVKEKSKEKVDLIYNWIDTNQLVPIPRADNILFERYELDPNAFYVTYCGNLGNAQNVEILIEVAEHLRHIEDLKFVIFGNGVKQKFIEDRLHNSDVSNVNLFPLLPLKEASYVYSLGDIGIVVGKSGTSFNGFPSKTWSIMAAGQSLISSFDIDSELSELVRENEVGIAVPPEDPTALTDAILDLYDDREKVIRFGSKGREYVCKHLSRNEATSRFVDIFRNMTGS
jgi:colanic acid biosynthesis glycosyl transferase WcaI